MKENSYSLLGRTVLITGAARRLGRAMAIAAAKSGADVVIHYARSKEDAEKTSDEIQALGRKTWLVEADLSNQVKTSQFCEKVFSLTPIHALINSAAIFKPVDLPGTTIEDWNEHLQINLTAPFQLSRSFGGQYQSEQPGKIINMLDWRALKPGKDHFPYTVSKSGLAAMTKSLALALAPNIHVNGIALGAILPPENEKADEKIIEKVPLKRWATLDELGSLVVYLLDPSTDITGNIIHLDGGRQLI